METSQVQIEVVRVYATSRRDSFCRECNRSVDKYARVDDGRTVVIDAQALPMVSAGFVHGRRVLTFALRDLHALSCGEQPSEEGYSHGV